MFIIRGLKIAVLLMFFTTLHLVFALVTLITKFFTIVPGCWLLFMKFFAYLGVIVGLLEFNELWAYLTGGIEHVALFALGVGFYFAVMYVPLYACAFLYATFKVITDNCADKRNELFLEAINK